MTLKSLNKDYRVVPQVITEESRLGVDGYVIMS